MHFTVIGAQLIWKFLPTMMDHAHFRKNSINILKIKHWAVCNNVKGVILIGQSQRRWFWKKPTQYVLVEDFR